MGKRKKGKTIGRKTIKELTVSEAAVKNGLPRSTVYEHVKIGAPHRRAGPNKTMIMIDEMEYRKWLKGRTQGERGRPPKPFNRKGKR